jgi:hypothetical protein
MRDRGRVDSDDKRLTSVMRVTAVKILTLSE